MYNEWVLKWEVNTITATIYSHVFMFPSSPHTPNDLTFYVAILFTSFLLVLSVAVPALKSDLRNILSPENLVPDGSIIILQLLL